MKQYIKLLREISEKGTYKPAARENMPGTTSLFGYQLRHDLQDGFPLLTTKQTSLKNIVTELLWFLKGDINIKYLIDNGCNIWNEDAYNYYLKKCEQEGVTRTISFDLFTNYIKNAKSIEELKKDSATNASQSLDIRLTPSNYTLGDVGFQYGRVWREWIINIPTKHISEDGLNYTFHEKKKIDQIANLIEGIKTNPESRRHMVTAIDPAHDQDLALYWCHSMFQFNCRPIPTYTYEEWYDIYEEEIYIELAESGADRELCFDSEREFEKRYEEYLSAPPNYYLDCQLYQRSADTVLGVPYNIASYSLLTNIIAKMCNMIPGEFVHTFGDAHIYDNHKEAVAIQLNRAVRGLPTLSFSRDFEYLCDKYQNGGITVSSFLNELSVDMFSVEGYNPHGPIKAKLSTGLK